jgi:hypothetical protein
MFMSNRWLWAAGLLLGMLGTLGAGKTTTKPPRTIRLKIDLRRPAEKPPVLFKHWLHEGRRVACEACHHDYRGRRNVWRQGMPVDQCQACHPLTPQPRNRLDIKEAFHRQCKGCHLKLQQNRRQAGPIDCRDCQRLG